MYCEGSEVSFGDEVCEVVKMDEQVGMIEQGVRSKNSRIV